MPYLSHLRWLVPLTLVTVVLWCSVVSAQHYIVTTDFVNRTPLVDVLQPAARLTRVDAGIAVQQEPVYVDVTLPLRASAVTLELSVADTSPQFKLGVQQGPGFDILFPPDVAVYTGAGTRRYVLRAAAPFYREVGYRLRFILSSPGFTPGSIVVQRARITIERAPFSWGWFGSLMKNFPSNLL